MNCLAEKQNKYFCGTGLNLTAADYVIHLDPRLKKNLETARNKTLFS
jgi:hypothetical protein